MKVWVWLDGFGVRSSTVKAPDASKVVKGSAVEMEAPTRREAIATYKHALSLYHDWKVGARLRSP